MRENRFKKFVCVSQQDAALTDTNREQKLAPTNLSRAWPAPTYFAPRSRSRNASRLASHAQSGFTLVELIVVIVVLGIISVGLGNIIGSATQGYLQTNDRSEQAQIGRFALERMSRELRSALSGSIQVFNNGADQCIRFRPIIAASMYLTLPLPPNSASTTFTAVDFNLSGNFSANNWSVAVNAIDPNNLAGSIASLNSISAPTNGVVTVTIASTLFPEPSVQQRFYIIDNTVTFCVVAATNTLTRNNVLLAENVQLAQGAATNIFAYNPGSLQRAGAVTIDLRLATAEGDIIPFSHTVFIRNVP